MSKLLTRLEKIETKLKDAQHVEVVIINRETEEVVKVIESKRTPTIRLLIRV